MIGLESGFVFCNPIAPLVTNGNFFPIEIRYFLGMYTDRIGSDRILVGSDKNCRLSENPTIRSEVSYSILNKVHIGINMRLTNSCEEKLIII